MEHFPAVPKPVSRVPITFMGWQCQRCGHKWVPKSDTPPITCPKCRSPYWNKPRRRK